MKSENNIEEVINLFESFGGIINYRSDNLSLITGSFPSSQINSLAAVSITNIGLIEMVRPIIKTSDDALNLTNINQYAWQELDYTGDPNTSIAILDTGFDDSHPVLGNYSDQDFTNDSVKMVGWYDATNDYSPLPEDFAGHGSHVAGIAVGWPYNNTGGNGIETTWSTSFTYSTDLPSEVGFYKYINLTAPGSIEENFFWKKTGPGGTVTTKGTGLYLIAPNGTLVDSDTVGTSGNNFTVSYTVSATELGLFRLFLGFTYDNSDTLYLVLYGNHAYSDALLSNNARFSGVAPDTKLVGVKVFNNMGSGTSSDLVKGLDWVRNNKETFHITVASMSLSFPCLSTGCTDSYRVPSVEYSTTVLVNSGVVVFVSAGNDYHTGLDMIGTPSNIDGVITVAATDDFHNIADYSSEGPGIGSNSTKPDLSAPGGVSTQGAILQVDSNDNDGDNNNSEIADFQPNDFTFIQGTSMATPHAAGIATLMVDAMGGFNNWNYSLSESWRIKQYMLMSTWSSYGTDRGEKDNIEGWGEIQADAALNLINKSIYTINSTITSSLSDYRLGTKIWGRPVNFNSETMYNLQVDVTERLDIDLYLYSKDFDTYGCPQLLDIAQSDKIGGSEFLTFNPTESGTYYLFIKTYSGSGNFTLKSTSYDTPNPTVQIINPIEGSSKTETYTVQISASSDTGINLVYARFSDSWVFQQLNYNSSSSYYEFELNTTQFSSGTYHSIVAKAVDNSGRIAYNNTAYSITAPKTILLVDDDTGANYETYYRLCFETLGISYDVFTVSSNGPTASEMGNYSGVVWFTGDDISTTLTPTDQSELQSYLNNNGNLFISGQDIGYDITGSQFYRNYLHATYNGDSANPKSSVQGLTNPFSGSTYDLGGSESADNNNYPDYISARPGADLVMQYSASQGAAITYSGTYNIIYFAFAFESLSNSTARIDAMNRTLEFLGVPTGFNVTFANLTANSNNYLTSNNIFLNWTTYGSPDYVQLFVNNSEYGIFTNNSLNFPLVDNIYDLSLVAIKNDIHYRIYSHVTVDTLTPVISISFPINNYNTSNQYINLTWTALDVTSGIKNITLFRNNTLIETLFEKEFYNLTLPSDGNFNVTITAYDKAGWTQTNTTWIRLDRIFPFVTLQDTSNGTFHPTGTLFNFSFTDFGSGVELIYYSWDSNTNTTYIEPLPVQEGSHILTIWVKDFANNWNKTIYEFTTVPQIPVFHSPLILVLVINLVLIAIYINKRKEKYKD
jgi:hypothetical protein